MAADGFERAGDELDPVGLNSRKCINAVISVVVTVVVGDAIVGRGWLCTKHMVQVVKGFGENQVNHHFRRKGSSLAYHFLFFSVASTSTTATVGVGA